MINKTQQTTKYPGVYVDDKGNYFYQTEFGIDRITGKRIRKKGRKDSNGKPFSSASEANKELTRLKREYHKVNFYANYKMSYGQFMNQVYIPYYKTEVEESTFYVKKGILENIRDRFDSIPLRSISVEHVQDFRTWLLTSNENGGAGYSQSYASLVFGVFRKSLDKAVEMQYLEQNVSKKVKGIQKGKAIVPYWTKQEFEKVISQIYIEDFYEHLNFVMIWVYYMTGIRVNEGTALYWNNVDLVKKRLIVHHMLIIRNRTEWKRNSYTKTEDGKRIIALDDDTIEILKVWKNRQKEIGLGGEEDFIFSYDGLPMIKSTIGRIINRYSKFAGVKKIQAKGLRHSHASYLINEFNVSVLILSQRMGHSSPEITLKHYAHMWSGADAEIAAKITGNINITTAKITKIKFNGNQVLKK
ncbi:transposase [Clostridium saccharobutylicum]|uniref:tyrosine-type recombinase/integrase n=1 Tax=Clostridium saccharobutylicum TaxID=169679 RepID=UPI000983CC71|nr:site-specific integrase [Clostridium saccharobutylicum]AQS08316.1 transposase [Clostridium saccharobutylicum]MBC2435797.1 site-specific integrase [Clostridium saccharobutylicum]NSB88320.1 integrase [Clostridium saccharobutylicum]NYC29357.1 integrase [Clostridium saccharobutylicum]OOM10886.1 transposase from transposon [Clostridium saccharobutylicum]